MKLYETTEADSLQSLNRNLVMKKREKMKEGMKKERSKETVIWKIFKRLANVFK